MHEFPTLSGTLTDLRPRTLLHFLGLTGKSGVLRAQGHERRASVRFAAGHVMDDDPVPAVVELLRLANGEFSFEESVAPSDRPGRAVAHVLADADHVVAEWEDVAQAVPSLGVVVRLRAGGGEARLSGDAWDVVAGLASGVVTPMALADHLDWSELRVCRAVKELADAGRAELLRPARPKGVLRGTARSVVVKSDSPAWHAADKPLWPGAGAADARARTPWDEAAE